MYYVTAGDHDDVQTRFPAHARERIKLKYEGEVAPNLAELGFCGIFEPDLAEALAPILSRLEMLTALI